MIDIPILAKDALREGDTKKEYRFIVYQTDGETVDFTIDNDTLVYESVKFDERMCSDTNLKFGLCEGTSLEFQAFNIPNITGRRIQAFVDVSYGNNQTCTIPMGWFTVSETSRQASTGILKITAYNKLQSTYLDANAKIIIQETFANFETVKMMDIISVLLANYRIDEDVKKEIPISRNVINSCNYDGRYFRYSAPLYGDHSILGASELNSTTYDGITTSTNLRFNLYCNAQVYTLSGNYPVKVRFNFDVDQYDANLYSLLRTEMYKANFSVGADAVMQELKNVDWNIGLTQWNFKGIYPVVAVEYQDSSVEIYGQTAYTMGYAKGTFADLNNITLLNVSKIYAMCPTEIHLTKIASSYVTGDAVLLLNTTQPQPYSVYPTQTDFDNHTNEQTYQLYFPSLPNGDPYSYLLRDFIDVYEVTNTTDADLVEVSVAEMPDVTLREVQTAVFETQCRFGQLDRVDDLFKGVTLNHDRLFPAETLYPSDTLYPTATDGDGQAERANKSMYSKLWADEGNIRTFRNLSITYKGTEIDPDSGDVSEVEKILTEVVNANGTDDYNMTSNWMFKNLVWSETEIESYAINMANNMRNVTWFPFELWCAGLPYVETGDELEISVGEDTYTSYVLRRTLKGIQNLQDEMINGTLDIF